MRHLESVVIEGYKSIESCKIDLQDINVLIGANGSGKSNFISAFRFLERIVDQGLQNEVASDPDRFLFHGRKNTDKLHFLYKFKYNSYEITLRAEKNTLVFEKEIPFYEKFAYGPKLGRGHLESKLREVVKKGKSPNQIPVFTLRLIENLKVYHFHDTSDTSKMKVACDVADNRELRKDASNLAAYLYGLEQDDQENYLSIVRHVRAIAPFFNKFDLRPLKNNNKIRFEWKQMNSEAFFDGFSMSDGTLRFICLATLLIPSKRNSLIILDEPELGLHPAAIRLLADMLKVASQSAQIILATQSPTLLSYFDPKDVIVVDHDGRGSTFKRLNEADCAEWLNDYSLGEIWEKNVFGGRP